MAILSKSSDLYALAAAYFIGPRPKRYSLFTIPAFVAAFRAMPAEDQRAQWANLSHTRNGMPTTFTPKPVVDEWFLEFCRSPSTFDFSDHIWRVGQCCPEIWLREQFAARMEEVKVTQLPPTKSYHGPSRTKAGTINKRMRTSWQGVLSPDWVHACVLKIVGEMDALEYQAWVGPAEEEARYPLLLVHEKNAQRGTFPRTRGTKRMLVRPEAQAAPRAKLKNPGRDAQRAALKRDSSARMEANIEADLALLAMGGTIKQLRDAMGARIGHKPRLGSVVAYLKYVVSPRYAPLDTRVVGPQYTELATRFISAYEENPAQFEGMAAELAMFGVGPKQNEWIERTRNALRKILPRT